MISPDEALAGRSTPLLVASRHFVLGNAMSPPFPEGMEMAMFGLGCFWGAERCFWQLNGAWSTAVGYAAGFTENPTYEEVCSGKTGHNEVVRVIFDSKTISYHSLLQTDDHRVAQSYMPLYSSYRMDCRNCAPRSQRCQSHFLVH